MHTSIVARFVYSPHQSISSMYKAINATCDKKYVPVEKLERNSYTRGLCLTYQQDQGEREAFHFQVLLFW